MSLPKEPERLRNPFPSYHSRVVLNLESRSAAPAPGGALQAGTGLEGWRIRGAEPISPFGLSLSKPLRMPFDELKVTGLRSYPLWPVKLSLAIRSG